MEEHVSELKLRMVPTSKDVYNKFLVNTHRNVVLRNENINNTLSVLSSCKRENYVDRHVKDLGGKRMTKRCTKDKISESSTNERTYLDHPAFASSIVDSGSDRRSLIGRAGG